MDFQGLRRAGEWGERPPREEAKLRGRRERGLLEYFQRNIDALLPGENQ